MTSSPPALAADQATNRADFVLEAGGVKGAALVGALAAFEDDGYRPNRIAGTSAGAVVGALFASRISASEIHDILITKKFSDFVDPTFWQRLPVPLLGTVLSELFDAGMYKGRSLEDYLDTILARHGVKTFAELRLDDPGVDPNVPPERRPSSPGRRGRARSTGSGRWRYCCRGCWSDGRAAASSGSRRRR